MLVHDLESRNILNALEEYSSFFADSVQRPEARRYADKRQKKEHLQKRGKFFFYYDKVAVEMQKLFNFDRLSEWNNNLKFDAVKRFPREEAEHMLKNTEAEELSTQWMEVDKYEFNRTESADNPPRMKSRLVA